jgi:aspartyl-tRNA(Asn)/glutamyl-tRNA(Gln) amidotransferase subunit A
VRTQRTAGLVGNPGQLHDLTSRIAAKTLSPVELVQGCLTRIEQVDGEVMAWVQVDQERALAEARRCEEEAAAGMLRGPLHGIPIGIKDIIDVEGLPTLCNSRSRAGRGNARADAEIVASAKAAGAIVLGKLQTTEFAFFDPAPTRNPHNPAHTPGGSSSGSGAAVASGMVPLTLGTQTFASVNRPAAYCGVSAFKPSTRSLSTFGVNPLAPYSDTIGFFGGGIDDAVAFYEAVRPFHTRHEVPEHGRVRIAMLEDALLEEAAPESLQACRKMLDAYATVATVETRPSPVSMGKVVDLLRSIMLHEMARIYRDVLETPDLVGPRFLEGVREGQAISDERYRRDRAELDDLRQAFFAGAEVDAFLWPAAPGAAPQGITSTGDPRFIAPWTALGGPIVTIPAATSAAGLPLGCILAGRPGADDLMCRMARLLARTWANVQLNGNPLQET